MRAPRLKWTAAEIAILLEHFPRVGAVGCVPLLPGREIDPIRQRAAKEGLRDPMLPAAAAARQMLTGALLARALDLRRQGWGCGRIGRELGLSEGAVTNGILAHECRAAGHRPAKRDANGALLASEVRRLHALLMQGLRGSEICLRLGISASSVSNHRNKLRAELASQRKAKTLPPPGAGEVYSGRKLGSAKRREVEQLFMQGLGARKIGERTDVSATQIGRIRNKLIRRLARRGECLPGCDRTGKRHTQSESARFIPADAIARFRGLLLDRVPVRRAAAETGIGSKSAYRLRDELAAELADRGDALPPPKLPGRRRGAVVAARWLPKGEVYRFRALSAEIGADAAKARILAEVAERQRAEAARPKSLEEQLARVRAGARLTTRPTYRPAAPEFTLGGVATSML